MLRSLGVAGDTDAGSQLVENLDDLLVEVVDDLYVRGFARSDAEPVFSRAEALKIARTANNDPQAHLVEPPASDERAAHAGGAAAGASRARSATRWTCASGGSAC